MDTHDAIEQAYLNGKHDGMRQLLDELTEIISTWKFDTSTSLDPMYNATTVHKTLEVLKNRHLQKTTQISRFRS